LDNYTITNAGAEFTIQQGSSDYHASSHTINFGSPVPAITAIYSGFVAGDDKGRSLNATDVLNDLHRRLVDRRLSVDLCRGGVE
jgi:hypothetical protein